MCFAESLKYLNCVCLNENDSDIVSLPGFSFKTLSTKNQ